MPGVQVDLMLGAVQPGPDSALCLEALAGRLAVARISV